MGLKDKIKAYFAGTDDEDLLAAALVKGKVSNQWFEFDDNFYRPVTFQQVQETAGSLAYMLFFEGIPMAKHAEEATKNLLDEPV